MSEHKEIATLGGGCFWCIEGTLTRLKGVETVVSGYTGGKTINPTYKDICTGMTGHAEVAQITFDPSVISFDVLLNVFFAMHDPTTLNRQGADVGTQYRSAIFYHNDQQKNEAEDFIKKLEEEKVFDRPIVTEVTPLGIFYPAEDYHQNYYRQNREKNSYCIAVIDPKINKLRKNFLHLLKD
jgi:peptide-methionine (S)-S-oxide reductase